MVEGEAGKSFTEEMDDNFEFRIRSKYHTFSKTQKKIAKYILNNEKFVLENSITVLAQKIGTNPSSITRFCQNLRYRGFNELKFYIENDLVLSLEKVDPVSKEDSTSVTIRKMLKYDIEALNDTMLLMNESQINRAVSLIANAGKVYFYAEGGTGSSAQFGYNLFLQIGVTSNCFTDPELMLMSTAHLKKGDVALCMSYSGCVEDVLNVMKFAKQNQASVICITGFPNSPFTKMADISLSYSCNIHDDLQYLHVARICEVAIIGILQSGIVSQMLDGKDKRIKDLKYAITSRRIK
ncbi:MAG: MurR/RpiR family transcriptional regulator [Lachnospiraceae bacterium]|nr:MurR/RpiR family transcriptional regulator [Lachnospiraceae bacterium]